MTSALHRRAALTVLAALVPVLLALGFAVDLSFSRAAWDALDQTLVARADVVQAAVEADATAEEPIVFEARRRSDGTVVARSPRLDDNALPGSAFAVENGAPYDVVLPRSDPGRAVTRHYADPDRGEVVVVVAASGAEVRARMRILRLWLWPLIGFVLAVGTAAAAVALRRALRPLHRVTDQLASVDEGKLGQRLVLADLPPELRDPFMQINELLARLEASFTRERRFSADVSHELRTPIAALQAVLELALSRPRREPEYREALERALATTNQLGGLVQVLLALSKAEAGQVKGQLVEVALQPLVEERWFALRETAAAHGLTFENHLDEEASFVSEEATLVAVIGNLLDNAVAYTDRGGRIRVHRPEGSVVEVWDSGPVPDAMARQRMFERFWREDAARSGAGIHVGLGLPLARALARAVGLDLVALAVDGGLGMRLVVRAESAAGAP